MLLVSSPASSVCSAMRCVAGVPRRGVSRSPPRGHAVRRGRVPRQRDLPAARRMGPRHPHRAARRHALAGAHAHALTRTALASARTAPVSSMHTACPRNVCQEARKTGVGLVVQNGVMSAAEPKRKLTPHRRKCDPTLVRTGRYVEPTLHNTRTSSVAIALER